MHLITSLWTRKLTVINSDCIFIVMVSDYVTIKCNNVIFQALILLSICHNYFFSPRSMLKTSVYFVEIHIIHMYSCTQKWFSLPILYKLLQTSELFNSDLFMLVSAAEDISVVYIIKGNNGRRTWALGLILINSKNYFQM